MNFYQFWDKLNGKPYEDGVEPPVSYDMDDLHCVDRISGQENRSYELKPLTADDMSQASAEEVADNYIKLHKGKNPCALGKPMTDEELNKFYGQTW